MGPEDVAVCGNVAHIADAVKMLAGRRVDIVALTGYANSDVTCFCLTPARFAFAPVRASDPQSGEFARRPDLEERLTARGVSWMYASATPMDAIGFERTRAARARNGFRTFEGHWRTIGMYARSMTEGAVFPAILVEGDDQDLIVGARGLLIIDGLATFAAASVVGLTTIATYVVPPGALSREVYVP